MTAKQAATQRIVERSGGVVQSGPFQGMRILADRTSWGDGDVGARLLGIYEQDLHPVMEDIVAAGPDCVVNVGCAEGYFAVGLAMRLPDARVIAVDISQQALNICQRHAEVNDCQVETGLSLPNDIPENAVWIVDIEGEESKLLNPDSRPELRSASILVELHPWVSRDVYSVLMDRFEQTHVISEIVQGDRSVNDFAMLADLSDEIRWSIASEGRPQRMKWLWMRPEMSP